MSKQIIIVDDNFEIVECLKTILKKYKYDVIHIGENFGKTIDEITKNKPNLILMDIDLNDKFNGTDLTKQIKNNAKTCDIPVIILTCYEDKNKVNEIVEKSFCDAYISKNYREKELIELIKIYTK